MATACINYLTYNRCTADKLIINLLYIIKLLEIMTDRFRGRVRETYFICWLIINKPQPNLQSWDTFIQGCLSWSRGCPLNRCSTVLSRPYHHEKQERRVWKGKLGKLSTCVYQIHTCNRCAKLTNQNHLRFSKLYDNQLHTLFCFSRTKNQSSSEERR